MFKITAIFTFEKISKQTLTGQFSVYLTEEEFITSLFEEIGPDGKELINITIEPIGLTVKSKKISYLKKRDWKYYFNSEVNVDSDTKKWREFRDNYYKNKNRKD